MPSIAELSRTLAELMPELARHGTFNMLLSNGQALWAHASTNLFYLQRRHPFGRVQLQDEDLSFDLASQTTAQDRVAIIATEPLTRDEPWTAFASGDLKVFVGGALFA
jgi:glutamine amidotransferase